MNLESSNLFAALDTKKKKKSKSSKEHDKKKKPDKAEKAAELDRAIFSQPVPASTNWADEDDEDEFDQNLGPLPESWAQPHPQQDAETAEDDAVDSDEDVDQEAMEEVLGVQLDKEDVDDDDDSSGVSDFDPTATSAEDTTKKPLTQKQLSKKERKKKELDELNATLAELGLVPKDSEASGVEGAAGAEAAAATGKKKKKKDKSAAKDAETAAVNGNGVAPVQQSTPVEEPQNGQEDAPVIEGGFKKVPPPKVKKPGAKKPSSAVAAAAAAEAKARASKKGKQKDKSTFNQAPTR